jgi:serine/threonine protein kinase
MGCTFSCRAPFNRLACRLVSRYPEERQTIPRMKYKMSISVQLRFLIFAYNQRVLQEMRVWSSVKHPNIVPLLGVSFDFDRPSTPCLVSPYYRHSDIVTYLTGHQDIDILPLVSHTILVFPDASHSVTSQIIQVATAISYLHSRSIVHGDIKGVSRPA